MVPTLPVEMIDKIYSYLCEFERLQHDRASAVATRSKTIVFGHGQTGEAGRLRIDLVFRLGRVKLFWWAGRTTYERRTLFPWADSHIVSQHMDVPGTWAQISGSIPFSVAMSIVKDRMARYIYAPLRAGPKRRLLNRRCVWINQFGPVWDRLLLPEMVEEDLAFCEMYSETLRDIGCGIQ